MPQLLKTLKLRAAILQEWRCFYCDYPMWDDDFDLFVTKHHLTRKIALGLKCTAEHLTPRCEGGSGCIENIVAACLICNQKRHRRLCVRTPNDHRLHVQHRLEKGKWHDAKLVMIRRSRNAMCDNPGD